MAATSGTYSSMAGTGSKPEEEEEEEKKDPLDPDTYGAAMFSMVEDITDICGGVNADKRPISLNYQRLIYVILVLLLNYALQFGMLFFIKEYVVDPAHEDQKELLDSELSEGRGLKILLTEQPLFVFVVLYLWSLTVLIQFRALERFYRAVNGLPIAATLGTMVNHEETDGIVEEYEIKGLTRPLWSVVMIMIVLPKALIVICLFALGFFWLASTESSADLILNALALEFVVNIDEQLFEAFLPKCIIDQIEIATLTKNVRKYADTEAGQKDKEADEIKAEWSAFRRAIIYYILPIVVPAIFIFYMTEELGSEFHDH